MSYDMGFWFEEEPIIQAVAASKYERMLSGSTGVVDEDDRLVRFCRAMLERYPDLAMETIELSPWTTAVYRTPECVLVNISWPRSREGVVVELLRLARDNEITSYDPQTSLVYHPSAIVLELSDGRCIPDPSAAAVKNALSKLSERTWYLILDFAQRGFVQVALGSVGGEPAHQYVIETYHGEAIHAAVADDWRRVAFALEESLGGRWQWQLEYDWRPLTRG